MPTVALIQMRMSDDPDDNLHRARELVAEAAKGGGQIICLPELYRTRYFPQVEDPACFELAEPIDGPSVTAFAELARERQVTIIVPIFERRAPGLYHNSAVIVDVKGQTCGHYRKLHIPDDPHFYEKYYFTPGDLGVVAVRMGEKECGRMSEGLTVGTLICWDQWYPEAARMTALRGAQIIFYPTAIGWHASEPPDVRAEQLDAWITMQRAHAIANGVFVAAVNRVGVEGELTFWGSSFVANPAGTIIARASGEAEEILLVDCKLAQIEEQRRGWPFLRDRRIDVYGELLNRYGT